MQTVWSRIAQATVSCRCPSCTAPLRGVVRGATTATAKRPTRFLTSSTLLYSGIFAAAATTDAAAKEQRSRQWDEAIAGLKQGLEAERSTDDAEATEKSSQQSNEVELDEIEAVFENLHLPLHEPVWPANTGIDLRTLNVPPQSLYAPRAHTNAANRKSWSLKKLHLNELAVDRLVLRLLLYLDDLNALHVVAHTLHEDFSYMFLQPRKNLERLLRQTTEKFKQTRTLPPDSEHEDFDQHGSFFAKYHFDIDLTANLNEKIKALFRSYREADITYADLLARLSWNLITSTAPPDVTCYNTILKGLLEDNVDHRVPGLVIRAMRDGSIRLNETSLVSILDYCRISDKREMFMRYVDLMRGMHNGLDLARPDINITEASQNRLFRIRDQVTDKEKVIQKPYPTPIVFGSLVKGVIHFCGLEAAIEVCQAMGQEGWGLSMKGMTPILMECANRGDWLSGTAVWEQIKLIQARSRRQGRTEKIMSTTLATMLHLCTVCDRQDEFHNIFEQALAYSYSQQTILDELARVGAEATRQMSVRPEGEWSGAQSETLDDGLVESRIGNAIAGSTSDALVEIESQERHELRETPPYEINERQEDEGDATDGVSSRVWRDSQSRRPDYTQSEELHRDQLSGHMPASHELDVYEEAERPTRLTV